MSTQRIGDYTIKGRGYTNRSEYHITETNLTQSTIKTKISEAKTKQANAKGTQTNTEAARCFYNPLIHRLHAIYT